MSVGQFCDAVWALLLSRTSAMMNPHEYREVLLAAFHWNDRNVDDVIAEQKARHQQHGSSKSAKSAPLMASALPQTELQKMQALLAAGGSQTATESDD